MFEILIVGSGPAGLSASIYAARAGKKTAVLLGTEPGGQLTKTTYIENFPGFAAPILGRDLMQEMQEQAKLAGVVLIPEMLESFEYHKEKHAEKRFTTKTEDNVYSSDILIIATGANAKYLGIEEEFIGYGVSTCATCDGNFYKGEKVAVIGGGNSALEESLYLSNLAREVILIHRRDKFRAEHILQQRVSEKDNIKIIIDSIVTKFIGREKPKSLEAIEIENIKTQQKTILKLEGVFIAIGYKPNTDFLKGILELDEQGYVTEGPETKIPGFYVAGDLFDSEYRQAITAAASGCMAAIKALKFLDLL